MIRSEFRRFKVDEGSAMSANPEQLELGFDGDTGLLNGSSSRSGSSQCRRQSVYLGRNFRIPRYGNAESMLQRVTGNACLARRGARPGAAASVLAVGGYLANRGHDDSFVASTLAVHSPLGGANENSSSTISMPLRNRQERPSRYEPISRSIELRRNSAEASMCS
ncbi:MAG TPA: hypothetical protein VF913_22230, partial [Xanthobacteraceae bacterium]